MNQLPAFFSLLEAAALRVRQLLLDGNRQDRTGLTGAFSEGAGLELNSRP